MNTPAADLAINILERIKTRFALREHGEPCLVLTGDAAPESVGAVRVFSGERLAKVVSVEIVSPDTNFDSQTLAAFAPPDAAIPHFVFSIRQTGSRATILCDLIARVDAAANPNYLEICYAPLTADFERAAGELKFLLLYGARRAIFSPWTLYFEADATNFGAAETAINNYLERWLALAESGLPAALAAEFAALQLYERDERIGAALADSTIFPAQIADIFGAEAAARIAEVVTNPRIAGEKTEIKKIAVFGATGGTGREVVRQALAENYLVTAFARTPAKLDDLRHKNLKIVQGDVMNAENVERAIVGQDAVVSALGVPVGTKKKILSEGTLNIIRAMEKHGVRRFICETSLGVGDSRDQPDFLFRGVVVPFVLRPIFADKETQENYIRRSSLEWVIVRPGYLTNGARTGNYRYGLNRTIKGRISRADVAEFMLKQLTRDEWLRQTPAIAG